MASQCEEVGSIDEWLDQFGIEDIYSAMPEIIGMWNKSKETTSTPKKNTEN